MGGNFAKAVGHYISLAFGPSTLVQYAIRVCGVRIYQSMKSQIVVLPY